MRGNFNFTIMRKKGCIKGCLTTGLVFISILGYFIYQTLSYERVVKHLKKPMTISECKQQVLDSYTYAGHKIKIKFPKLIEELDTTNILCQYYHDEDLWVEAIKSYTTVFKLKKHIELPNKLPLDSSILDELFYSDSSLRRDGLLNTIIFRPSSPDSAKLISIYNSFKSKEIKINIDNGYYFHENYSTITNDSIISAKGDEPPPYVSNLIIYNKEDSLLYYRMLIHYSFN